MVFFHKFLDLLQPRRILERKSLNLKAKSDLFLTDTHAHLASSRFKGEVEEVVERASEAGVKRIVSISCDAEDSKTNLDLSLSLPSVYPTVGVHPLYIHEINGDDWMDEMLGLASHPSVVAIGEIGLDYYHPPQDGSGEVDWRRRQREVFENLLQLSLSLGLPVVIHQRESAADVIQVLRNFTGVTAVLHCFSGSSAEADEVLAMGHYVSFTGILTFKGAGELRKTASLIPLDRIMLETDCPYLAPEPFRGKKCEPSMLVHTARILGNLHGLDLEAVANSTSQNASRFFSFDGKR